MGMIVYEFVTNVARHAFFEGRDGEVRVELSRAGAFARCGVSDNGSTAAGARPGRGLKIIGDLAKSLGRVSRNGRDLERENKPVFYLTENGPDKAVTNL